MSEPAVRASRVSFTWLETNLSLLQDTKSTAPYSFLGRDYSYEPVFDNIRALGKTEEGLLLPWQKAAGEHFWTYYLDGVVPGNVKANDAWHAVVPIRVNPPKGISVTSPHGKVTVEGFFFPHAIATVFTFDIRPAKKASFTLKQCVEIAHAIRHDKILRFQDTGLPPSDLKLDAVKDGVQDALRKTAFGPSAVPGKFTTRPFSVMTFLSLAESVPNELLLEGSDHHRAFQALTEWSSSWDGDDLSPLPARLVRKRTASPKSDVMFAGPRSRVIWMPKLAADQTMLRPKLSCYHRNQVLATMQIDALIALVNETDEHLNTWASLGLAQRECARLAAGALTRLWLGKPNTYQSRSCQRQLADADVFDALQRVRTKSGLLPFTLP